MEILFILFLIALVCIAPKVQADRQELRVLRRKVAYLTERLGEADVVDAEFHRADEPNRLRDEEKHRQLSADGWALSAGAVLGAAVSMPLFVCAVWADFSCDTASRTFMVGAFVGAVPGMILGLGARRFLSGK
jgi:hypothetical protein